MSCGYTSGLRGPRWGDLFKLGRMRDVLGEGQAWKGFDRAEEEASWEWAQQVQRPWGRTALQTTHRLVEPKAMGAGAQEEVRGVERPQI